MRFVFWSILLFGLTAQAECLSEHLSEAQKLNALRRPLYSDLTDGASERISDLLISEERKAYRIAVVTEIFLWRYHRNDIPILCEEFIPMSLAPDFLNDIPDEPIEEEYLQVDVESLVTRLNEAFEGSDFQNLGDQAVTELAAFAGSSYNCMTKHVLESIARSSYLADKFIKASEIKNLTSPKYLLWASLKSQIGSFRFIENVDIWSAPIQKQGIPIVCNDVPHIPIHSEWGEHL